MSVGDQTKSYLYDFLRMKTIFIIVNIINENKMKSIIMITWKLALGT